MYTKSHRYTALWVSMLLLLIVGVIVHQATNLQQPIEVEGAASMSESTIELVFGQGEPHHAIIWLHGLGATADDFPPIVPELGLDASRPVRFVFPQAPERPITINGGMRMPGWYDIKGMNIEDKEDAEGMAESRATLEQLIQSQVDAGVPSQNIIIAGFSQGGAVAYYTSVRSQHKLAGVLALSTYLPFASVTVDEQSGVNSKTPIFASHGIYDPVVPMRLGQSSAEFLQSLGYPMRWQTYPMEHNVSMQQISDIGAWINETFTAAKP